jgi:hypothetical protein
MVRYAPAAEESDPLERLGDEIAELAAHVHAATGRLLLRLAEFDRRAGWAAPGFLSCAHWLSWRTGVAPGAAREKVRVARALTNLPLLAASLQSGELSYAKVRAITRVATPNNESDLLELARTATAAQVERVVRAWRRVDRLEEAAEERARHRSRSLTVHSDVDGMVIVRGRLDPEAGALLERALAAAAEALYGRRPSGEVEGGDDAAARRADALGLIAELALRGLDDTVRTDMPETADTGHTDAAANGTNTRRARVLGRADRFLVHVHVDVEALRECSAAGQSILADSRISAETSRRLSCDAGRVLVTHDRAIGETLELDPRRRRTISPALRRALERRDRGCRFPGCGNRFCDAHHIVHWADGGATTLANTVLLCRSHHRAVHESSYRIEVGHGAQLMFIAPDGRSLREVPPAPIVVDGSVERLMAVELDRGVAPSIQRLDMDFTLTTLLRRTG